MNIEEKYPLNINNILRYLGYKDNTNVDKITKDLINLCINEVYSSARPVYITKEFTIDKKNSDINITNTNFTLSGFSIQNYLLGADKIVLLAATLGIQIDNIIRIAEKSSISKSMVLDVCASELIESVCDYAQNTLNQQLTDMKQHYKYRFSPGYGDFPIQDGLKVLKLINAEKLIGITMTENYVMIPRKSVTAVIGIFDNSTDDNKEENIICINKCENCNLLTCSFRNV